LFTQRYWSFGNATYNYVLAARSAGYATLAYDRLGAGQSDHPDPYLDVQGRTQVAILVKLTQLARDGHLSPRIPKPQKVVHVGHSYGSLLSNALVAAQPNLSDGLILTGFTHNTTWISFFEMALSFHLARENNPHRFGQLSSGYITWGDKYDNQAAFFNAPFFDIAVLELAEQTKTPFALAELLSFMTLSLPSPQFEGPVLVSRSR
jgi:pimeloyl-ACP methyl ester carboxylesterase